MRPVVLSLAAFFALGWATTGHAETLIGIHADCSIHDDDGDMVARVRVGNYDAVNQDYAMQVVVLSKTQESRTHEVQGRLRSGELQTRSYSGFPMNTELESCSLQSQQPNLQTHDTLPAMPPGIVVPPDSSGGRGLRITTGILAGLGAGTGLGLLGFLAPPFNPLGGYAGLLTGSTIGVWTTWNSGNVQTNFTPLLGGAAVGSLFSIGAYFAVEKLDIHENAPEVAALAFPAIGATVAAIYFHEQRETRKLEVGSLFNVKSGVARLGVPMPYQRLVGGRETTVLPLLGGRF